MKAVKKAWKALLNHERGAQDWR